MWALINTERIKKSINNALKHEKNVFNYNANKKRILNEIKECSAYLVNEHTLTERIPYFQKLDSCLADISTFHPKLTDEIKRKIESIRTALSHGEYFSFVAIAKSLNDIISILKQEDFNYYD